MLKQSELDYSKLIELMEKKEEKLNRIPADSVRNRMHKVAFDVYNIENDPYNNLWMLESSVDGKEYLVRMENDLQDAKTGDWVATSNENGTSITLAYKNVPIQRLSGKIFGFSKGDVELFKKALVEKVINDNTFRSKILNMQTEERKIELTKAFPELAVK